MTLRRGGLPAAEVALIEAAVRGESNATMSLVSVAARLRCSRCSLCWLAGAGSGGWAHMALGHDGQRAAADASIAAAVPGESNARMTLVSVAARLRCWRRWLACALIGGGSASAAQARWPACRRSCVGCCARVGRVERDEAAGERSGANKALAVLAVLAALRERRPYGPHMALRRGGLPAAEVALIEAAAPSESNARISLVSVAARIGRSRCSLAGLGRAGGDCRAACGPWARWPARRQSCAS